MVPSEHTVGLTHAHHGLRIATSTSLCAGRAPRHGKFVVPVDSECRPQLMQLALRATSKLMRPPRSDAPSLSNSGVRNRSHCAPCQTYDRHWTSGRCSVLIRQHVLFFAVCCDQDPSAVMARAYHGQQCPYEQAQYVLLQAPRALSTYQFRHLHQRVLMQALADHPRDHPGKYLYYAGTFWLYLQSHCRLHNVALVCVLCAYNGHLTMALV
jgi:hypothetical protein